MNKVRLQFNRLLKQFFCFLKGNRTIVTLFFILIFIGLSIYFFDTIEKYFSCLASYYFGGETSPKGEFLKIILQIIGGTFVIVGAWTALRQVKIMKENSVADKLKNAIEQLGSDKTSIVVGSLHSLNQIAKNNKEYIPQVLSTFISHVKDRMDAEKDWSSLTWDERKKYRLPTEVQTILDILFRNSDKVIYKKNIIDLSRCKLFCANLNYADMQNAYLNKVQLQGALLSYANFMNVNIENADLSSTELISTNFSNAKLSNSYFIGARIIDAKFQFAKLRESHFEHADINSVHFEGAFLHKANFIGCDSIDTNFTCADLSRADFSGSRLIRQNFSFGTLSETKFFGSFIKDSGFKNTSLLYTRFNGACSKLNSGREELSYDFLITINQRIDKETEFDKSILFGKVSNNEKQQIIENFKKEIQNQELVTKFTKSLDNPLFEDTNDIVKGLLSKHMAENEINQFNNAIKFAGIKL